MPLSIVKNVVALLVAGAVALNPLAAVNPAWAGEGGKKHDDDQGEGKGKGKGHEKKAQRGPEKGERGVERSDKGRDRDEVGRAEPARSVTRGPGHRVFADPQRVIVHDYYVTEYRAGRCPPGLAKKNNGCMPPGQAKKWHVGHPLPRDVIFYDLPPALVVQIGTPPPGYRYVRVAADILLIAIGTGLVIEAITDLGRL
jgi:Ni/Co efflux regulator RcnB